MIEYVWAEDKEKNIGLNGHLPWHLPADMKHFKELTINHPIIMGRKTFESFPNLLPKRKHIVLTHSEELKKKYRDNDQVVILSTVTDLQNFVKEHQAERMCAIGGVSIFKALMDQVEVLEKTEINAVFEADTKMPNIDYTRFKLVAEKHYEPDEKNKFPYTFLTYKLK